MRTVTGPRRRSILAIAALLIGGCLPGPSVSPRASSVAGLPSDAVTSPSATLGGSITPPPSTTAPTLGPDASCEAIDLVVSPTFAPPQIDAQIGIFGSFVSVDVVRAESITDASSIWTGEASDGGASERIALPGGRDVPMGVDVDFDREDAYALNLDPEVIRVTAELQMQGHGKQAIDARIDEAAAPGDAFLALPDVAGKGMIKLEIEISDRCMTYTAIGDADVRIVAKAVVDACPVNFDGYEAHWAALSEPPIQVGAAPVVLEPTDFFDYWNGVAIDNHGNYDLSSWDRSTDPAIGPAGGTISLRDGDRSLRLLGLTADFYRRKAVIAWQDGGDQPPRAFQSTAAPLADGSLDLLLPPNPAQFVAGLVIRWESDCGQGSAVGSVSIEAT